MVLSVELCENYTLGMACNCSKSQEFQCGINYRQGT